ncbi:hypothetical protein pb186bvf_018599 [Paramecium bursaria]
MEYDYIGALKIKDGLFLGDQFAAQDLEFIVTNKVTRIVNCAGKQIPNHWETIGIVYLSYPWLDNESQAIFQTDEAINNCIAFIDEALNKGESVIVHSIKGHNRSIVVLCVYFMKKYRWTLYKTLQYMHNRRHDLEIRANFFNQLLQLESRFQKNGFGAKTYNWDEIYTQGDPEEVVLRNTYINSQSLGVAEFKDHDVNKVKQNKLTFAEKVTLFIPSYDKITFQKRKSASVSARTILKQKELRDPQVMPLPQPPQLPIQIKEPPARPISQDVKRVNKSESNQKLPEASSTYKPKKNNNFMDSGEQFFLKSQPLQQQQLMQSSGQAQLTQSQQQANNNPRRPQTAPNQLRAPRLQVTPYKRNTSSNQRNEATSQPAMQFKPMGNRQRAHSPNQTYNGNPYAQKQFKQKMWKK